MPAAQRIAAASGRSVSLTIWPKSSGTRGCSNLSQVAGSRRSAFSLCSNILPRGTPSCYPLKVSTEEPRLMWRDDLCTPQRLNYCCDPSRDFVKGASRFWALCWDMRMHAREHRVTTFLRTPSDGVKQTVRQSGAPGGPFWGSVVFVLRLQSLCLDIKVWMKQKSLFWWRVETRFLATLHTSGFGSPCGSPCWRT